MKCVKAIFAISAIIVSIAACSNDKRQTLSEVEEAYARRVEENATDMDESMDMSQPAEFDGVIVQKESGLSLRTGAGEFIIENQDLTDMAGKKVKIIGSLEEFGSEKKIHITSVTPIE